MLRAHGSEDDVGLGQLRRGGGEDRQLLGEAAFERRVVEWSDSSVESYADFMLESFGPLLNARDVLGERSTALRSAFIGFLAAESLEDDGTLRFNGEYLVSIV